MFNNFKNILVLAPHTDDGELGCGGFISKSINLGSCVTYVAFSTAIESVPEGFPKDVLTKELKEATKRLGIKKENLIIFNYQVRNLNFKRQHILEDLIKIRNQNSYDLVLIPNLNDIHQDHSTVSLEGLRAFKNTTILGYELIWNNIKSVSNCFVKLSTEDLDKKIYALDAYKSQKFRDYTSPEFIRSLGKIRGTQIGTEYAESFEVIRLFL